MVVLRGILGLVLLAGCATTRAERLPTTDTAPTDLLAVHDTLERRIVAGTADEDAREQAYEQARGPDDGTAGQAYARAAIAGRLAEVQGLRATGLVREAEVNARLSLERDPEFRDGSARRLLGSLYALAADYVEHGDSETGLELLHEQTQRYPMDPSNHLRLGEAYTALGDVESAHDPLCAAHRLAPQLDPHERRLLDDLLNTENIECGP